MSILKKLLVFVSSAILLCLFSCSTSDDSTTASGITSVTLSADALSKVAGATFTFQLVSNAGNQLSTDVVYYSNDVALSGNTLTTSTPGSYQITATYGALESNSITVVVQQNQTGGFVKRVLIEDYTGTWCGYCPRVAYGIEKVQEVTDKAVVAALHYGPNDEDPYHYNLSSLISQANVQGFPTGKLNRAIEWSYPEPSNVSQVTALTEGANAKVGLAMNATVANGNITLAVKAKFNQDYTGLKMVVYALENGLHYNQQNYTTYYNGASVIQNFQHDHVLRLSMTDLLGESISSTSTVNNGTFTKSFAIPVPANVANAANLEFVAFIMDANNKVINVRKVVSGENQAFEEL